jgi:hypothetical protein
MKRSWTAPAVALVAVFAVAGCNDYGNTFQNNTGATLFSLSPPQISAGHADFTLTLNGGGFVKGTVVQWNGKTIPTTLTFDTAGNVTSVTATVATALIAKPGIASVNTLNPFHGTGQNGLSNPVAFTINPPANPIPTLTNISPTSDTAGSANVTLTLTGANFLPATDPSGGSLVQWSAGGTLTTLANPTITAPQTITVMIPSSNLANPGTAPVVATVTVFNPPSPPPANCTIACTGGGGGGASLPKFFNICPNNQACSGPVANSLATAASVAEETPAVNLDGRYVAYTAVQNEHAQVFLHDTCEGAAAGCLQRTIMLSAAADGAAANEESHTPSMSSDGRYVAFSSSATNLVENAPVGRQVYLRDTCAGAADSCKPSTQLISTDSNGALVGTESILPSVSSSGRFIAFLAVTPSRSANKFAAQTKTTLTGSNNSGYRQVFIRDTCLGAANCIPKTTRISLQPGDGAEAESHPAGPALSGSAKHVAIAGGNAAMLFTRSVAVDDRVFLAIANQQR